MEWASLVVTGVCIQVAGEAFDILDEFKLGDCIT